MSIQIPEDKGAKKRKQYWNICVTLGIIAIVMTLISINQEIDERGEYVSINYYQYYQCANGEQLFDPDEVLENNGERDCSDGSDEHDDRNSGLDICGGGLCCCSMIFAISALSTKSDDRVIVIQQPARYVPVVQQPVIQQDKPQPVAPKTPDMFAKTKGMWTEKARNLEMARNWEGAAEAYEKAGMYSEAGKIRQEYLENNQPIVQIGQVGDTVLNDSVMISDSSSKSCNNCGNNVEGGWNICPNCSNPL